MAEGFGETVVEVVVVTIDNVHVVSPVNTHLDELMSVVNLVVGIVVHRVVLEGVSPVDGDSYPDRMDVAGD